MKGQPALGANVELVGLGRIGPKSLVIYSIFVRPHLESGVQAANHCFKHEANMLGQVQRRGTEMLKGLSGLSYEDRVRCLNPFPLS